VEGLISALQRGAHQNQASGFLWENLLSGLSAKAIVKQGDQIGPSFVRWVIYFGKVFWKLLKKLAHIFGLLFHI
jgi:hypothetical protein